MQVSKLALIAALALSGAGCTSLSGYPHDPQPDTALDALRAKYFSDEAAYCYSPPAAPPALKYDCAGDFPGTAGKQAMRDTIVLNRIHVYDMEFSAFVRALSADANTVSVGTDFAAFALNGLATTTGNAGTKAALAAASTGVLAANGAIDKDIFYQKTIPALVAQMEADRTKAEGTIITALKQSDADYPLERATLDLDALNRAGSINGAVANITEKATTEKKAAEADLAAPYRDTTDCRTDDCIKIRAWLLKDDANAAALVKWCNQHVPQKYLDAIPFPEALADTPGDVLDVLRAQAIKDLSIN